VSHFIALAGGDPLRILP